MMKDVKSSTEIVDEFLGAISAGDFNRVSELYHEDVGIWHNFSQITQDKEINLAALREARKTYEMNYEVRDRIVDGDRVIQQHILTTKLANGQIFRISAAMFLTVKNGKITLIEEYLDTGQVNSMRTAAGLEPRSSTSNQR